MEGVPLYNKVDLTSTDRTDTLFICPVRARDLLGDGIEVLPLSIKSKQYT
ncbi:hypothetical protein HMPREF9141_2801 [Prevotella multiformis DSM 16608]|uniref:Uncharacterized protein n=1 Tax=Prevotella multiformis DSM 16608 TaxID=888743 RepID=F0FB34_9BACT|nr:hypothetical protein HMPREF9141_2801 [Prevotella multiformis DSM 16608]